ncbi:MAG: hypothetical protein JSS61_02040 [Verrucomicrobia bacterium]|nr:hypothetical protein [Verrucomicrobiota bacterium]
MAEQNLPSDLSVSEKIGATQPIAGGEEKLSVPTQSFSAFMKPSASPMETSGKAAMVSPFELMQGQPPLAQAPSIDTLLQQINSAQSTAGDIQSQLATPDLKLKASQKYLLKNKLSDATEHLRSANVKMGAPVPEEVQVSKLKGPLGKFLGYLTDGQNQLESAKKQLSDMKEKGESMAPADFLTIQVKMNKAQQELEFASVLLSNAVSSLKILMQVQL